MHSKETPKYIWHHTYLQIISKYRLKFPKPVSHHHLTFPQILSISDSLNILPILNHNWKIYTRCFFTSPYNYLCVYSYISSRATPEENIKGQTY